MMTRQVVLGLALPAVDAVAIGQISTPTKKAVRLRAERLRLAPAFLPIVSMLSSAPPELKLGENKPARRAATPPTLRAPRTKDSGAPLATRVGPKRDRLAFELDRRETGTYATQGQLRAIILLVRKTAELAVLSRAHDDSLGELLQSRRGANAI